MNSIPDATTVAFFRKRLRHAAVIAELFELFDQHLRAQGYQARGGQIIDATLVPVPQPLGFCEAIATEHPEGERDHHEGGYPRGVVGTAKTFAAYGY